VASLLWFVPNLLSDSLHFMQEENLK